jgi:hypothetical protein
LITQLLREYENLYGASDWWMCSDFLPAILVNEALNAMAGTDSRRLRAFRA